MNPRLIPHLAISFLAIVLTSTYSESINAQTVSEADKDYSAYSDEKLLALANNGDIHAIFTQGFNLIFNEDLSVKENADFVKALPLLQKAHDKGHDTANSTLTLYYYGEIGNAPEFEKADKIAIEASERGSGVAQLNYGLRYITDEDPEKSKRAFNYLKQSASDEQSMQMAYPYLLEILYGTQDTQYSDAEQARQIALKCLEVLPNEHYCPFILGRDFEHGWGGTADIKRSTRYFERAASLGEARSQWITGMKHLNGEGVEKSEERAFQWVQKAAAQDYTNGLLSLAVMHALGQGTEKNLEASFETYEIAARQGSAHALRGLGSMYCAGEAPVTDKDICAAALIYAYENGDANSAKLLNYFFQVENQDQFETLKRKTKHSHDILIHKYGLEK